MHWSSQKRSNCEADVRNGRKADIAIANET